MLKEFREKGVLSTPGKKRPSKTNDDLAKAAYIMASVSQCVTTMCLQYTPDIVACVCIHLVSDWQGYKIEPLCEGKEWFTNVNKDITLNLLDDLKEEFKVALDVEPRFFRRNISPRKDEKIFHYTITQVHNLMTNNDNVPDLCAMKLTFPAVVQETSIKGNKIVYFLKDNTGPGIEVHVGIRESATHNKLKIYSKEKHVRVIVNIRQIEGRNCLVACYIREVNNNTLPHNATEHRPSSLDLKKHTRDSSPASSSVLSSIENVTPPPSKKIKLIS